MADAFRRKSGGLMIRVIKQIDLTPYIQSGRRNVPQVLKALAARGAQKGRSFAPRRSGRLAGSMRFHYGGGEKRYAYRYLVTGETGSGVLKGLGKNTAVFGTDVPYAPYVEWGTKFMAGLAMLRAAADDVKRRIKIAFRNIVTSKVKFMLSGGLM